MDAFEFFREFLWVVIVGYIIAFVLALAIGANDVANSFGTSVGSGVLTLNQACILAAIFETLGAVLLGYRVSNTMRRGIIDITLYEGTEEVLMLGSLASLIGCAVWLFIATYYGLPVSTTHSIVGATVGFSVVNHGWNGVSTREIVIIAITWVVSPILSGIISGSLFLIIRTFVLHFRKPFKAACIALPVIYTFTIFLNIFVVMNSGSPLLGVQHLETWMSLLSAIAGGIIVGLLVQFIALPKLKVRIDRKMTEAEALEKAAAVEAPPPIQINTVTQIDVKKEVNVLDPVTLYATPPANGTSTVKDMRKEQIDKVQHLFKFLQILTACFGAFVHGGNDVSNAIAPLVSIWLIYTTGAVSETTTTPIYMLVYGGLGISVGLFIWGRRVIDTIGRKIAEVTPTTGFIIEIGSASTVLFASGLGIPVSTTHCQVGSVVAVGFANSKSNYETEASFANPEAHQKRNVDWGLFRNIFFSWLVTLPAAGGFTALFMWIFKITIL